jgi:hypothetical protein
MQTYDEIEAEVRKLAHSLPPSDFGSTRAIQAIARFVIEKIARERDACATIAAVGTPEQDWHPTSIMGQHGKKIAELIRTRNA